MLKIIGPIIEPFGTSHVISYFLDQNPLTTPKIHDSLDMTYSSYTGCM